MLISVRTASQALKVTPATVRRYIEQGKVGAVRRSRTWLVAIPRSPDVCNDVERRLLAYFPESTKLGAIEAAISRSRRENAPVAVYFADFAGRQGYTTLRADGPGVANNIGLPPSAITTRVFQTNIPNDWRDVAGIYAVLERACPGTFSGCAERARARADELECTACKRNAGQMAPSHAGSRYCHSGSIASGGRNAHCTCDVCF